jgi:malonyl-CoA/methylmalonyl-CoA synthetase
VQVRLWDDEANKLVSEADHPGEIQVRGPGIFKEYWGLAEATAKEFDGDWFKTGDIGARSKEHHGMYKILGRNSVDIIKVSRGAKRVQRGRAHLTTHI